MHIAPDFLTQITALRKSYSVILRTDNIDCFDRLTVLALHLDIAFDGIVNSFNEARLKIDNSGANFMRSLRGDITDAVLLDDSESTCQAFERLGGSPRHVNNKTPEKKHLIDLAEKA